MKNASLKYEKDERYGYGKERRSPLALLLAVLLCVSCAAALYGCGGEGSGGESAPESASPSDPKEPAAELPVGFSEASFSDFDLNDQWTGSAVMVRCDGAVASASGRGIDLQDGSLVISMEGTYFFLGDFIGQLRIEAPKTAKVHLVFSGFRLTSEKLTPIYAKTADKVSITLASGTENEVIDNGEGYSLIETEPENRMSAAIHAECALTVNGKGSMKVNGHYRHGIFSQKTLRIIASTVEVTASEDGIRGKNGVLLNGCRLQVKAVKDGIKSTEKDDPEQGMILIGDSRIVVDSGDDGIDASTEIVVRNAELEVSSTDHCLNSAGKLLIDGKNSVLTLSSREEGKGITAAKELCIAEGKVTVADSFEGMESTDGSLYIIGGEIRVNALDDGLNAETMICVGGGYVYLNAKGDGMDSNGDIELLAGTVIVCGPRDNKNSPIDCGDEGGEIHVKGARLIAYGSKGQAKYPTPTEGSCCCICLETSFRQDTVYAIRDPEGKTLCTFSLAFPAESVCVSVPELREGTDYTLYEDVTVGRPDESVTLPDGFMIYYTEGGKALETFELKAKTALVQF